MIICSHFTAHSTANPPADQGVDRPTSGAMSNEAVASQSMSLGPSKTDSRNLKRPPADLCLNTSTTEKPSKKAKQSEAFDIITLAAENQVIVLSLHHSCCIKTYNHISLSYEEIYVTITVFVAAE